MCNSKLTYTHALYAYLIFRRCHWPQHMVKVIFWGKMEVPLCNSVTYQNPHLFSKNYLVCFHLDWTIHQSRVQVEEFPHAVLQWVLVMEVEAVNAVLWNMRRPQPVRCHGGMSPHHRQSTFPLQVEKVRLRCMKSIRMESLWPCATPQTRYFWDWGSFQLRHSCNISNTTTR